MGSYGMAVTIHTGKGGSNCASTPADGSVEVNTYEDIIDAAVIASQYSNSLPSTPNSDWSHFSGQQIRDMEATAQAQAKNDGDVRRQLQEQDQQMGMLNEEEGEDDEPPRGLQPCFECWYMCMVLFLEDWCSCCGQCCTRRRRRNLRVLQLESTVDPLDVEVDLKGRIETELVEKIATNRITCGDGTATVKLFPLEAIVLQPLQMEVKK